MVLIVLATGAPNIFARQSESPHSYQYVAATFLLEAGFG
jgi:hypothetical protein